MTAYRARRCLTGSTPTPNFPHPDFFEIYEIGEITDKTLMDGVFESLDSLCRFLVGEYPRLYVTQPGRESVRVTSAEGLAEVLTSKKYDLSFLNERPVEIRPSTDREDVAFYPNRQAYFEKIRKADS